MDLDPRLRPGGDGELGSSAATGVVSNASPSPAGQLGQSSALAGQRGRDSADTPSSTVGSTPGQHHQFDYPGDAGGGGGDGGAAAAGGGGGEGDAGAAGDAKKSRACEACRGLKVRCEPDPVDGEPCKRCRKAGRNCIVTVPTRKRQKKTDSRVSELEKKIDALTASLHARAGVPPLTAVGQHQSPSQHQQQHQHRHQPDVSAGGYPWGSAGTAQKGAGAVRSWGGMDASPLMHSAPTPPTRTPQDDASAFQPPIVMAGQKRKATDRDSVGDDHKAMTPSASWSGFSRPTEGDIVDRGLITMETAAGLFNKYKDHMVRHLPAVVFPPSATVMELRKTKPTLFLAVMAAATGENHSLQRVLQKELMQLFAEKVIVTGEKNLELVQAMHVAVIWYWPPEHFEELKFYQLIHIAAVMAIDIGLGRKGGPRRGPPPFRRNPPPDSSSIECRRTWLTCFFLALNTSMSLHRPNLIRWTPFMTECLEILETSADAAPTDKYFCHLVWAHRLAEEVGGQFSLDDPSTMVNITDARTQYALRALERDLDKYIASIPKNLMQRGFSS
ncbi:c6 transcription factor war1 [Trichoderma arundinaceum]|uniref:C6 transcription factor war1 n=1 Tax=Trichoderma arundinaceum TaxID=490622 RepID=A0A395N806_TRIAR|nr:c6 transcription factor war1 [Trichoderma arundinaceum]